MARLALVDDRAVGDVERGEHVMRREYQRGIALIAVLWITMLLAVIAASFTSSVRTEVQLARNMVENAKAEALADGAVHRAVLGILEMEPERAWRTDGRPYRLDYGGGSVVVRVFDEDSKIDLNAAPAELLGELSGADAIVSAVGD